MKLDCVLTACNTISTYCEFIPFFIKTWNKLYPNVDVKIILINDVIPEAYNDYKNNIILFKPIPNISTAFTSQYIRLLYPALLNYENGILITDIDMIPMNSNYYIKNIENIENNKFVYYRTALLDKKQIAICYVAANNTIWKEIFNIHSVDDIYKRFDEVIKNYTGIHKWCIDQVDLYKYVMAWNNKTNNFITINDHIAGFKRLNRGNNLINNMSKIDETTIHRIKTGYYSDYHCLRPYSNYKLINDEIIDLL